MKLILYNNYSETNKLDKNKASSLVSIKNSKWYIDVLGSFILPVIKKVPFK